MITAAKSYQLKFPISSQVGDDEETITTVQVRRPVARDFRAIDAVKGEIAQSLTMIEQLTGLMRVQVDKLDGVDMAAIGEIIEGFMLPGLPTGEISSAT
ncbi:hypothetical protein BH09PSE4_BH09PSE4_14600 [soil metagenome]